MEDYDIKLISASDRPLFLPRFPSAYDHLVLPAWMDARCEASRHWSHGRYCGLLWGYGRQRELTRIEYLWALLKIGIVK